MSENNFYPSLNQIRDNPNDIVLQLKRSQRSILGIIAWALFLLTIVLLIIYFFPKARFPEEWPIMRALSVPLILLIPIGYALEALRRYYDDLYLIEKTRVVHKEGRLSLKSSIPAVHYRDIRALTVIQSWVGRILDYGSVELNTGALDLGELTIRGVRAPEELASLIDSLRRDALGSYVPGSTFED